MHSIGVLAVLVFGLVLAHNKTAFSPKVFPVLMHIWEYITFLANTLIFFIVGVVIIDKMKDLEDPGLFPLGHMPGAVERERGVCWRPDATLVLDIIAIIVIILVDLLL